jgi:hypothetical protein
MNYLSNYLIPLNKKDYLGLIFSFHNLKSDVLQLAFSKHFNLIMQHFMVIYHLHSIAINKFLLNNS